MHPRARPSRNAEREHRPGRTSAHGSQITHRHCEGLPADVLRRCQAREVYLLYERIGRDGRSVAEYSGVVTWGHTQRKWSSAGVEQGADEAMLEATRVRVIVLR